MSVRLQINEYLIRRFPNSGSLSFYLEVSHCIRDLISIRLRQHQLSIKFRTSQLPRPSNFNLTNSRMCRHLLDGEMLCHVGIQMLAHVRRCILRLPSPSQSATYFDSTSATTFILTLVFHGDVIGSEMIT